MTSTGTVAPEVESLSGQLQPRGCVDIRATETADGDKGQGAKSRSSTPHRSLLPPARGDANRCEDTQCCSGRESSTQGRAISVILSPILDHHRLRKCRTRCRILL